MWILGWAVSYRDESRLVKLPKLGFVKGKIAVIWEKDDLIHPYKKGLLIAKACGTKLRHLANRRSSLGEAVAFCQGLVSRKQKPMYNVM